ncbi:intercellular trafficking and secretion [Diatrype stigma]|uniref:Sorting nexin-4 n=1 Tax=Diatrype stigma TaxID=117547 RepID=A0AAN9V012_9PEZI
MAKPTFTARRRFTDFVFLYKTLCREYPASAVPPIPDKQRMEYVRGDRFGSDFTNRRAYSLQRFLSRIALHPVLRRAPILHIFLESPDWNATMRARSARAGGMMGSESISGGGLSSNNGGAGGNNGGGGGVFDNFADTFINAFTKPHRHDRRFVEVRERADKLDEDLAHVEKVVARVAARREADLEQDLRDLAEQFQRLVALEPGVDAAVHGFAAAVGDEAAGLRRLRDKSDQDYVGSLRDMQAYGGALRSLLKAREQKQLDYEQLTEYLNKSSTDRDALSAGFGGASGYSSTNHHAGSGGGGGAGGGGAGGGHGHGAGGGVVGAGVGGAGATAASLGSAGVGFIRSKLEDVRGVDHEAARRERLRRLELRVDELTAEAERAKKTSELFDDEVVREVADFERIKRVEMRRQLGGLADEHVRFYGDVVDVWERYLRDMEAEVGAGAGAGEDSNGGNTGGDGAGEGDGGEGFGSSSHNGHHRHNHGGGEVFGSVYG